MKNFIIQIFLDEPGFDSNQFVHPSLLRNESKIENFFEVLAITDNEIDEDRRFKQFLAGFFLLQQFVVQNGS